MKAKLIPFTLISVFFLSFAYGRAGDGLNFDSLKIYPALSLGYGHDDNVFYSNTDKQSDSLFDVDVAVDSEFTLSPQSTLAVQYKGDFMRYQDFSDEDTDFHELQTGLSWQGSTLYGKIENTYSDSNSSNGILFTQRVDRRIINPSINIGADFNRLGYEAGYELLDRKYDDTFFSVNDHKEGIARASILFHAFPKTDFLAELKSAKIKYDVSGRDGEYQKYLIGVDGDITSKIDGTIKLGYQDRKYDDSRSEDLKNFVLDLSSKFHFTESIELDLDYAISAEESIIFGSPYYEYNRIEANLFIKSELGFEFEVGSSFEQDKFPFTSGLSDRKDDVLQGYAKIGWDFQSWMSVSLKYENQDRSSNFNEEEYTRGFWLLQANFKLTSQLEFVFLFVISRI